MQENDGLEGSETVGWILRFLMRVPRSAVQFQESVEFSACQVIFDAEGRESRLRCLIQGGESGVWLLITGFRQRMTQFSAMPKTAE